jgi:hypothetical protein
MFYNDLHILLLLLFLCFFIFLVQFNQDLSMAIFLICTPTTQHLILKLWYELQQGRVVLDEEFKQCISFFHSIAVEVEWVNPWRGFSIKVSCVFLNIHPNVDIFRIINPCLERFESIPFSLIPSNTFKDWWSHGVTGVSNES